MTSRSECPLDADATVLLHVRGRVLVEDVLHEAVDLHTVAHLVARPDVGDRVGLDHKSRLVGRIGIIAVEMTNLARQDELSMAPQLTRA